MGVPFAGRRKNAAAQRGCAPPGRAGPRAPRRWPRFHVRWLRLRAVTSGSLFPEGSGLGTRGAGAPTSDIQLRGVRTLGGVCSAPSCLARFPKCDILLFCTPPTPPPHYSF